VGWFGNCILLDILLQYIHEILLLFKNQVQFFWESLIGRSGQSTTAKTEAIGRLISLCLRTGVDVKSVIKQIKGIGGEYAVFQKCG